MSNDPAKNILQRAIEKNWRFVIIVHTEDGNAVRCTSINDDRQLLRLLEREARELRKRVT